MRVIYLRKQHIQTLALVAMMGLLTAAALLLVRSPAVQVSSTSDREVPIYMRATDEKQVAITLDAAWGSDKTEEILDILDSHGVKATFFLVGYWVDAHPEQVQQIAARGHEIGNHSSTHCHMAGMSRDGILSEINTTNEKIRALTGREVDLFRPPYGEWDETLVRVLRSEGHHIIQWSIDSLDWKGTTAGEMVERVEERLEPGSIILFHNNSEHILEGLDAVLTRLKQEGYRCGTVSELISKDSYTVDHRGRQYALPDEQKEPSALFFFAPKWYALRKSNR